MRELVDECPDCGGTGWWQGVVIDDRPPTEIPCRACLGTGVVRLAVYS